MIKDKTIKQVYNSLIRSDDKKPKHTKLASCLPVLSPETMSWSLLLNTNLIKQPPKNPPDNFSLIGSFGSGRQLQIPTTIYLSVLPSDETYLTFT